MNFVSVVAIIFGGVAGFFLSDRIGEKIVFLLPFIAGTFIYIAASDLIPQIKKRNLKKSVTHFLVF